MTRTARWGGGVGRIRMGVLSRGETIFPKRLFATLTPQQKAFL